MPRKASSGGQAMTPSEMEARLREVISEEAVLNECLAELEGIDAQSPEAAQAALEGICGRLQERVAELDLQETALKECLETLDKHIERGVGGELPETREGLEARISDLDALEAALTKCLETLDGFR